MVERFSGEWKTVNFDDVITPKARIGWQGLRKDEYLHSGYSYLISGTDFHDGTISLANIWQVSKARYDMDRNIQVTEGDVLVTKDGTIGKVAVVPKLSKPATLNSHVYVFRTKPSLNQKFLYYVLLSENFRAFIDNLKSGSIIVSLPQKDLKHFSFMLPPLEEQHAIADTLSAFDRHISALSALIAKKQAIRQGALEDLMTGRTRLEGFCGSWKTVKLGDMLKISRGASPRPIEAFLTSGTNGVNWIKIGDASKQEKYITQTAEKITEDGAAHSVRVKAGDFILSNSMSFGRPYILRIDGCIHDGWLRLYDYQDFADREFLYYLLSSSITRRQYVMFAAGSGVQNLNKEVVKKIEVNLPPLDEQLAISSVLSALDSELSALNSERAKFSAIRQAAISGLLTGKIRLERTTH